MRYGTPGIPAMLNQLKLAGAERVLLMPMYPQYSSSTTATAFDDAFTALEAHAQPAGNSHGPPLRGSSGVYRARSPRRCTTTGISTAGLISRQATNWC